MGQVNRIAMSVTLITSLGCGPMPSQTRLRSQAAVAPELEPPTMVALADDAAELSMASHDHDLVSETMMEHVAGTALPMSEDVMGAEVPESPLSPLDSEPRVLKLYDLNDRTALELAVNEDGSVDEADRLQLEYFFRCRRTQQTHAIAQGLLKILYAVDRAFPDHVLEIVSGFRSYPFGVRDSKHFEGHAIDLRLRGVRTTRVRDFVWKHFAEVGVGYYGHQNFVHVDYRPEDKDTAWTSPEADAAYAYNPSWAMRIRAPGRAPRAIELDGARASR